MNKWCTFATIQASFTWIKGKPLTSLPIRNKRIAWARVIHPWNVDRNWSNTIFNDKSSFNIYSNNG